MLCVCMLQRGHSGDECDLASTLCKYDVREGNLLVLTWAMVRRVSRGLCGVCRNVCCVTAVVEDSVLALEC